MKLLIVLAFVLESLASAGVIKVVTYPVRHPIHTVKKTGHVAWKIVW